MFLFQLRLSTKNHLSWFLVGWYLDICAWFVCKMKISLLCSYTLPRGKGHLWEFILFLHSYEYVCREALGMDGPTKTDEFSEKFQTAFDPPPSFLENYIADFATKVRDFAPKVRMFILARLLNIIWSHEMHSCGTTVQHCNWLKTYPEKTILYHFHAEKALFKGPKSAI